MIPADDALTIRKAYDADVLGEIDVPAIDAIEAVTKHDVIAFLTWAGEKLGPERRWLHQGMTSSDVLDTSLAVQLMQSAELLLEDVAAGCEQPGPIDEVVLVVNGETVSVPISPVSACQPMLTAIYAVE